MHPNPTTKGIGTLYISDEEDFKEVKSTNEFRVAYNRENKLADVKTDELTLSAKLTHKEFYYKRKGKRYVRYSEVKDGIDEKIWRKLLGE